MKRVFTIIGGMLAAFAAALLVAGFAGGIKAKAAHVHCYCGAATEEECQAKNIPNHTWTPITYNDWSAGTKMPYPAAGATKGYCLTADVSITSVGYPGVDTVVDICLCGHTISASKRIYSLKNGTKIRITDCTGNGHIIGSGANNQLFRSVTSDSNASNGTSTGSVEFYGGTLDASAVTGPGPAAYIQGGSFSLYDGTIIGASTSVTYGGAIFMTSGTINIYGGEIKDGHAGIGGNINAEGTNPAVNVYGGKITGGVSTGTSAASGGGNIYMDTGTLTIYGGEISGGSAAMYGPNVRSRRTGIVVNADDFVLNGAHVAAASGNALSVQGGSVTVQDSTIEATGSGGVGALVSAGTLTLQSGAIISTNGRGINNNGAIVNISGGTVVGYYRTGDSNGSYAAIRNGNNGTLNISGGVIRGDFYNPDSATSASVINMTGGYFDGLPTGQGIRNFPGSKIVTETNAQSVTRAGGTVENFDTYLKVVPDTTTITSSATIQSQQLTLNDGFKFDFYSEIFGDLVPSIRGSLDSDGDDDDLYFEVTLNGESVIAPLYWSRTQNMFKATFDGITPECIGDTITVTIYKDGASIATGTTSIYNYLTVSLPASDEYLAWSADKQAAANQLVADILKYGREAQIKRNHNTDNLISLAGYTPSTGYSATSIYDQIYEGAAAPTTQAEADALTGYFKEATVIHEDQNRVRVVFKNNTNDALEVKLSVGGATATTLTATPYSGLDFFFTEKLKPTEYGTTLTFTAYVNGSLVSTLTYSVNSYCQRQHLKGDTFADALYNYGASAVTFAGYAN